MFSTPQVTRKNYFLLPKTAEYLVLRGFFSLRETSGFSRSSTSGSVYVGINQRHYLMVSDILSNLDLWFPGTQLTFECRRQNSVPFNPFVHTDLTSKKMLIQHQDDIIAVYYLFFLFFLFWDTVSLCILGWPRTCYLLRSPIWPEIHTVLPGTFNYCVIFRWSLGQNSNTFK